MESKSKIPRYAFDRKDHELIRLVNEVLQNPRVARTLYYPYLPPQRDQGDGRDARAALGVRRGAAPELARHRRRRGPPERAALPAAGGHRRGPGPDAEKHRARAAADHEGARAGLRRPAAAARARPRVPHDLLRQAAHRAPSAPAAPPAGDARRVEPDRLRRPRPRRQHQGPQVVHPPAHGRLDQGHPPAAHHPLQLHRAALRRRAVRRRAHPRHRRAHRHRVLGPLPGHVRAAHLGAARVRGRPGLPVLPGGAAGHAADGGGATAPRSTSRST